ncbi:MAG: hypothetical protein LKJ49_07855 [Olsenella sp.]|jgi:transcriptional regulator with XRE-family HTH domain|nr:hypothetical protein [Olsenella sp.]
MKANKKVIQGKGVYENLAAFDELKAVAEGSRGASAMDTMHSCTDRIAHELANLQKKLWRRAIADGIRDNIRWLVREKFGNPESGDDGIGKFAKLVGISRNRAGSIFRGNTKAILNLKVSDIADFSRVLGVTPGVLIGELTEDEQETIDALRELDDYDKNFVRREIKRVLERERALKRGHDTASGTGVKSSSENNGL